MSCVAIPCIRIRPSSRSADALRIGGVLKRGQGLRPFHLAAVAYASIWIGRFSCLSDHSPGDHEISWETDQQSPVKAITDLLAALNVALAQ